MSSEHERRKAVCIKELLNENNRERKMLEVVIVAQHFGESGDTGTIASWKNEDRIARLEERIAERTQRLSHLGVTPN